MKILGISVLTLLMIGSVFYMVGVLYPGMGKKLVG